MEVLCLRIVLLTDTLELTFCTLRCWPWVAPATGSGNSYAGCRIVTVQIFSSTGKQNDTSNVGGPNMPVTSALLIEASMEKALPLPDTSRWRRDASKREDIRFSDLE